MAPSNPLLGTLVFSAIAAIGCKPGDAPPSATQQEQAKPAVVENKEAKAAPATPEDCSALRKAANDICTELVDGKAEGLRCAQAITRVRQGNGCDRWVKDLERNWQQSNYKFDPWSWGPACTGYLEGLGNECLSALDGTADVPESCVTRYKALIFELQKMLRVPGNEHLAEALEKHCTEKSTQ
jgi:hypothetical protein